MKFALDTPHSNDLRRIERFSGWCLTDAGLPVDSIVLRVNGLAAVQLERTPRWDLVAAFPDFPEAVNGGFAGDLAFPEHISKGSRAEVELVVRVKQVEHVLSRRTFRVAADGASLSARQRSYRLEDILVQVPRPMRGNRRRNPGAQTDQRRGRHLRSAPRTSTMRARCRPCGCSRKAPRTRIPRARSR